jgi:two-component system alkaline phosphatase synthesis response regulator PhoP
MEKKLKILVVDDEPDVVEILSYNLKKNNYDVYTSFNGSDAIEAAKMHHPDIILMDIRMPGKSGIETCREMRTIEMLKTTPVLFLTADSDEYTTLNAFEAGADHFITKPIRPSILMDMIKEVIKSIK